MDWLAERARPGDLAAALELIHLAELPDSGVADQFGHFFVVRDEGRIVGVGGLEIHGEHGLLRSVVVEPSYRGQGLGAMLVAAILELAAHNELTAVYLLTTTAQAFFASQGFEDCPRESAPEAIGQTWEFRVGCPSSAAFMKRNPPPAP